MENLSITIEVKEVYGNELYYPQTFIKELKTLTRTTTLTAEHISALVNMGFRFNIIRKASAIEAKFTAKACAELKIANQN